MPSVLPKTSFAWLSIGAVFASLAAGSSDMLQNENAEREPPPFALMSDR